MNIRRFFVFLLLIVLPSLVFGECLHVHPRTTTAGTITAAYTPSQPNRIEVAARYQTIEGAHHPGFQAMENDAPTPRPEVTAPYNPGHHNEIEIAAFHQAIEGAHCLGVLGIVDSVPTSRPAESDTSSPNHCRSAVGVNPRRTEPRRVRSRRTKKTKPPVTPGTPTIPLIKQVTSSTGTVPLAFMVALYLLGCLVGCLAGRHRKGPMTVDRAIDAPSFTGPATVDCAIDAPGSTGPATVDRAIQCASAEGTANAETAASSEDTARDETATVKTADVEAADEHHIVDGAVDIVGSVSMPLKTMPASKILPAGTGTLVEPAPTTISDSTSPSNTAQPHSNIGTHTSDGGLVVDIGRTKQALFTASSTISQPEERVTSAGAAALSAGDTTLPVALPVAQPEEQISFAGNIGRPGEQLDNSNDEHANIPHEPTLADSDDECSIEGLTTGAETPQQAILAINRASLQQRQTQTRGRNNELCGEEQRDDGCAQQLPLHADGGDNKFAGDEQNGDGGAQHLPPQADGGDEWSDGAGTPQAPTAANCDSTHGDRTPRTDKTGSSAGPSLTGHDIVCPVAQVASGLSAQHTQATNYGRYRVLQILAGQSRTFYATVAKPRIGFSEYARGPSRLINQSLKRSLVLCDRPIEGLRAIKCSGSATQARHSEPATPAEPCASEPGTDKQRHCRLFKRLTDSSSSRVAGLLAAVNASLFGHLDETGDPQHRPQFICVDSPMAADEPPPMPETGVAGPSDRLAAAAEAVGPPLGQVTTVDGGGEASFDDTHPQLPCVSTSMQPLGQDADPGIEYATIPAEHQSSTARPPASSLTRIESSPSSKPTQATRARAEQDATPAYQSTGGPFGSTGRRKSRMRQANKFGSTMPRENADARSSSAVPQQQEHAATGQSNPRGPPGSS
ncbi:hypothetical protein FBU31_000550, partial [Coemansia sp. 'formosensis']